MPLLLLAEKAGGHVAGAQTLSDAEKNSSIGLKNGEEEYTAVKLLWLVNLRPGPEQLSGK